MIVAIRLSSASWGLRSVGVADLVAHIANVVNEGWIHEVTSREPSAAERHVERAIAECVKLGFDCEIVKVDGWPVLVVRESRSLWYLVAPEHPHAPVYRVFVVAGPLLTLESVAKALRRAWRRVDKLLSGKEIVVSC